MARSVTGATAASMVSASIRGLSSDRHGGLVAANEAFGFLTEGAAAELTGPVS